DRGLSLRFAAGHADIAQAARRAACGLAAAVERMIFALLNFAHANQQPRIVSGRTTRVRLETVMDDGLELSILDLVQLADDKRFSTAVTNSVRLAKIAEESGYGRYWIAEHHGPNLSCASPEVMIAAIASATNRIRVGSAGVLLSYYSPLKVAE